MKKLFTIVIPIIVIYLLCLSCTPKYNLPSTTTPIPIDTCNVVQDSQMLIFTTFSGGGSRAMAMAWEVCNELSGLNYEYVTNSDTIKSNILKEIDYSSGVSGGSFVTAALPIYKNDWQLFYERAVSNNIQRHLIQRLLLPWNWPYLISPYYTRTDLAAEYYNKYLFNNNTFSSISTFPKIYINSTLLAQGVRFSYTPDYFKYISSDLSSYPIGYACAASSAFPVGFSPITVKNYGKTLTASELLKDRKFKRAFRNKTKNIDQYSYYEMRMFLNNKENAWLHNQDGGLVGNTGLDIVLNECKTNGQINKAINNSNCPLKKIVIIIVDAGTKAVDNSCTKQKAPNSLKVVLYSTTTAMDVLSNERLSRIKEYFNNVWQNAEVSRSEKDFYSKSLSLLEKPFIIEVNARNINDTTLYTKFNKLPTSFYMNKEQLKTIHLSVQHLLKNNKEYIRFKNSIIKPKD